MSDLPIIPLCQVEFLQDFTINFGVYLAAKKPGWARFFQADVKVCEHEGKPLERLTIWKKPTILREQTSSNGRTKQFGLASLCSQQIITLPNMK